jgi:hypothetical protein
MHRGQVLFCFNSYLHSDSKRSTLTRIGPASRKYDKYKNPKKGAGTHMVIFNKNALFFVVLYSVIILLNTYLGETERVQSNFVYFLLNGFAYIVSAMEIEKEKQLIVMNKPH